MTRTLVYFSHEFYGDHWKLAQAEHMVAELQWKLDSAVGPRYLISAPWIPLCRYIADSPDNREKGFAIDEEFIRRHDELWTCGSGFPFKLSSGMSRESHFANKTGRPVMNFVGFSVDEIVDAIRRRDNA